MDTLFYILAIGINIFIAIWILRKYSIFSCPGFIVIFTLSFLLTDAIGLGAVFLFNLSITPLFLEKEIALRVFPTFLCAIGFFLFALGLAVIYPKPRHKIEINLKSRSSLKYLKRLGLFFISLSLLMILISLATEGFFSFSTFFTEMHRYGYITKKFEFLTYGQILAFVGFALLIASSQRRLLQFIVLIFSGIFGILLTTSKSGLMYPVIAFFTTLYIYQYRSFRYWFKPAIIFVLLLCMLVGISVKGQVKNVLTDQKVSFETETVAGSAYSAFSTRWGPIGLYRGYSALVERIKENPWWSGEGKVSYFAAVAPIPRFLWPQKPITPTKGIGYLVDPYQRVDPRSAYAPTLMGSWFWDLGLLGVIFGMFFSGIFIGGVSRFFSIKDRFIKYAPAYLFFVLSGVSFAEAGFINFSSRLAVIIFIVIAIGGGWAILTMLRSSVRKPRLIEDSKFKNLYPSFHYLDKSTFLK